MARARVRGAVLFSAAFALFACGEHRAGVPVEASRLPIVGGSADAGFPVDDVFLLQFIFSNGVNTICSGTLISARSLVTAAHCVDPARQGAASVTIKATHKPTDQNLLSSDLVDVVDYRLHPSWTSSATAATYDIALLLLAQSPAAVTPRPLNRAALGTFVGANITLVGYGRTAPSVTDSGARRAAGATVSALATDSFDFGTAGVLGICAGDSGGPSLHVFPDLVERVVGVHSLTTSASCGSGTDTRIDFHLGFIDTWLAQKEGPGDGGTGGGGGGSGGGSGGSGGGAGGGTGGAGGAAGGGTGGSGGGGAAPTASLGDPCVQGSTVCLSGTVCTAPVGSGTICRRACETDGGCPQLAHCEAGVGTVSYCRADTTTPPVDPPPATGCGCGSSAGAFSAALWLLGLGWPRRRPARR